MHLLVYIIIPPYSLKFICDSHSNVGSMLLFVSRLCFDKWRSSVEKEKYKKKATCWPRQNNEDFGPGPARPSWLTPQSTRTMRWPGRQGAGMERDAVGGGARTTGEDGRRASTLAVALEESRYGRFAPHLAVHNLFRSDCRRSRVWCVDAYALQQEALCYDRTILRGTVKHK